MNVPIDPTIISEIAILSLKSALTYLIAKGIVDLTKPGYEKIKKIIIDKQNEGKYAFVPDKNEALFLKGVSENPNYKQLILLVPRYNYLNLIRTGFLIKEYNEKIKEKIEVDKNHGRVRMIKNQILKRPGGRRLLKITKFIQTGFFSIVLKYLYDLKTHGYPEEHLEEEFNSLIEDWENSSKYVKRDQDVSETVAFCKHQSQMNNERFFILAMYEKQISIVEKAIKILEKQSFFKENFYEKKMIKGGTEEFPILEVIIYKKI